MERLVGFLSYFCASMQVPLPHFEIHELFWLSTVSLHLQNDEFKCLQSGMAQCESSPWQYFAHSSFTNYFYSQRVFSGSSSQKIHLNFSHTHVIHFFKGFFTPPNSKKQQTLQTSLRSMQVYGGDDETSLVLLRNCSVKTKQCLFAERLMLVF